MAEESKILNATNVVWTALSNLGKVIDSIATDTITLREARAVRAALYQAAVLDQHLKKELY